MLELTPVFRSDFESVLLQRLVFNASKLLFEEIVRIAERFLKLLPVDSSWGPSWHHSFCQDHSLVRPVKIFLLLLMTDIVFVLSDGSF